MRSFVRWGAALIAASSMVALSQASEMFQLQEFQLQERASVDILALMPKCGLNCLISSIGKSVCSPTNNTCLCTNVELNDAVTLCVSQNCTIPEALVTKNLTSVNCDAPIRDQGTSLANMSIALAVISWALVLARLAYKRAVLHELSADDIVILVLLIIGIPSVVITVHGTVANGLGRDVWTLTPTQIDNFGYYFYIMEVLYFANLTLLKLTLLFFYLRIFPGQGPRRLLWGTIAFVIVWGVAFIFIAIFQCNPISYFWTNWDGLHKGQCLGVNAIGWANAAISITLDFWMLAIPLWEIRGLQLHWKKKLGVALMFIVGTFVTVVSILRLQTLVAFAASSNPTYDQCQLSVWSTVEVNVGIFCACMPTLRLMLVRWVPALGSTSNRSGYRNTGDRYNGNGGTGGSRGVISSSRKRGGGNLSSANTEVNVAADPHRHDDYGSPKGITYHKSYNVTYGDQGSQVNLRDLNRKGVATAEASSDISDI